MTPFDFVDDEELRKSMESDYRELESAMQAGAWKSAHVLAGSVVEAILTDHLLLSGHSNPDPLSMMLGPLINYCRQSNIVSQRVVNLSDVIRDYRNLIHPGKSKRTSENPTKDTATIAVSLLNIIISEVSDLRQRNYGYTADQIIVKIEVDGKVDLIIKDILNGIKQVELRRLLLDMIPNKSIEIQGLINEIGEVNVDEEYALLKGCERVLSSLSLCYAEAFEQSIAEIKGEAANEFVKTIKQRGDGIINIYLKYLFKALQIKYLPVEDQLFTVIYLFSLLKQEVNEPIISAVEGIGIYLDKDNLDSFIDPLVRSMTFLKHETRTPVERLRSCFESEYKILRDDIKFPAIQRMYVWSSFLKEKDRVDDANFIYTIASSFDMEDIPF